MAQPIRLTADALYEHQIRPLPLAEQLHIARRIIAEAVNSVENTALPRSLLELEGLGAELWKSVDAQEYMDGLRREWDARS